MKFVKSARLQIFHKSFNFFKPEFSLKFVFKTSFPDQAIWDFLDSCSTFSAVCIKKISLQKFCFFMYKKRI